MNYHISTYAFAFLNQSTNLIYAYLRQDFTLMFHRIIGTLCNFVYISIFLYYCNNKEQSKSFLFTLQMIGLCFVGMGVDYLRLYKYTHDIFNFHMSVFGALTGILLAAGPLATIRTVISTKNASSLPLPFLVAVTSQCIAWTLYGFLQDDVSTLINNLVGVFLGAFQLCLIAYYGRKTVEVLP
jgi:solute carrier family 50 (sugar transporter)